MCVAFLPLSAQTEKSQIPWSTNEGTMIGFGSYNLRDTYLSPGTDINYTGWEVRVMNERIKMTRLADYNIARQQVINVEFGSTRNGAETASEYAGFVDYSLGYLYKFENLLIPSLNVFAGATAKAAAGFLYNTRNSNNPVSGKADLDVNLSAMATYSFNISQMPFVLRYQTEIPMIGMLFSVHKGQPYYYLTQGDSDGVVCFSSLHNKFAMKNYFTIDIPICNFTVRTGYLNSIYRTNINGIKTHVISNSFMIGFVKEFVSFGGKKLRNTESFRSAYY